MIGEKILQMRKQLGISQSTLAKRLKLSVKTIKNWENDISDPSLKSILALCDLFHISSDDLLGRNNDIISLSSLNECDKVRLKRVMQIFLDT